MAGKSITDHKFFGGAGSPAFPKGVHLKSESSDGHSGEVMKYEDTTETIKAQQVMGSKKIAGHKHKEGTRN